ncbi:ester cyclase [Methylopila turkensis]|uniref:Ester cyclase n=1 Tax=Methylopila turkensis TaxID=1437816 RepID=A0A9W6JMV1_9HYPH|nr:ester cyclase [Methylopila turkensis]GLK80087.1 hypothetical protein GCM10008174_18280 [Methylopila turkensis]
MSEPETSATPMAGDATTVRPGGSSGPNRRQAVQMGMVLGLIGAPTVAFGESADAAAGAPRPMSQSRFAAGLIRIGEDAIARENDAALDAYFAPDFVIHSPGGDLPYGELKAYFAALRAAFADLRIRRAAIVGEGRYLASRTMFSGTFTATFSRSPVGPLRPHGRHVEWEVMNLFRYDEQDRLAEEWVSYDVRSLLQKLGAA